MRTVRFLLTLALYVAAAVCLYPGYRQLLGGQENGIVRNLPYIGLLLAHVFLSVMALMLFLRSGYTGRRNPVEEIKSDDESLAKILAFVTIHLSVTGMTLAHYKVVAWYAILCAAMFALGCAITWYALKDRIAETSEELTTRLSGVNTRHLEKAPGDV